MKRIKLYKEPTNEKQLGARTKDLDKIQNGWESMEERIQQVPTGYRV